VAFASGIIRSTNEYRTEQTSENDTIIANQEMTEYISDNLDQNMVEKVDEYSEVELKDVDDSSATIIATDEKNGLSATTHMVTIEYTLADKSMIADGMTITDMYQEVPEAFYAEYESSATLYTVEGNDDCFVAFINPGLMNQSGSYLWADFTDADRNDPTIFNDDIQFDKESGIAYIPKSIYFDENGEEIEDFILRAQVLVAYDPENVQNVVNVTIENEDSTVKEAYTEKEVVCDSLDVTTTIPLTTSDTAENLDLSNVYIFANGNTLPIALDEDEDIYFDRETGELTIAVAPVTLFSLQVKIQKKSIIEQVASLFNAKTVYAKTTYTYAKSASNMKTLPNATLNYEGTFKAGTFFKNQSTTVRYYCDDRIPKGDKAYNDMTNCYRYCYYDPTGSTQVQQTKMIGKGSYSFSSLI
jgi:hypothetical protein